MLIRHCWTSEAFLLQKVTINIGECSSCSVCYDKHRRVFLMQCMFPSTRALNKLLFVESNYAIYVLEGA